MLIASVAAVIYVGVGAGSSSTLAPAPGRYDFWTGRLMDVGRVVPEEWEEGGGVVSERFVNVRDL